MELTIHEYIQSVKQFGTWSFDNSNVDLNSLQTLSATIANRRKC